MSARLTEVGSVDPALADDIDVQHAPNCIGQDVYVYRLKQPLTAAFFDVLHHWGALSYPLGVRYPVVKLEARGCFLLSGILGTRELRLTLQFSAPVTTRRTFEADLVHAERCDVERCAVSLLL